MQRGCNMAFLHSNIGQFGSIDRTHGRRGFGYMAVRSRRLHVGMTIVLTTLFIVAASFPVSQQFVGTITISAQSRAKRVNATIAATPETPETPIISTAPTASTASTISLDSDERVPPGAAPSETAGVDARPAVPADAVDMRTLGAEGNGVADDTNAIANALRGNAGKAVVFRRGTYIVNDTFTVLANTRIYGEEGAVIQAGSSLRGDLAQYGRHFFVDGPDVTIDGLTLVAPTSGYPGGVTHDGGAIDVYAPRAHILRNTLRSTMGIAVKESQSTDVVISHNELRGGPDITYTYAGSSRTTVSYNIVDGARANGMRGVCNTPDKPNVGAIVEHNVITNAGRMGIEDYGECYDTIIRGNTIRTPGATSADGFGISAIGYRCTLVDNMIEDFKTYGIESPSTSVTIERNQLRIRSGESIDDVTAIILNGQRAGTKAGATVTDNIFENVNLGVNVWSDARDVRLLNNRFRDARTAISIDSQDANTSLLAERNDIQFTIAPSAGESRAAFRTYSGNSNSSPKVEIRDNTVVFAPSSQPGTSGGRDWFVKIGTDNLVIDHNIFDGGLGETHVANAPQVGGNGAKNSGVQLTDNTFRSGATFDLSGLRNPILHQV